MKPQSHTPTPLHVETNAKGQCLIRNESGYTVAIIEAFESEVDQANAAFIVSAVNAHEELIALLKEILMSDYIPKKHSTFLDRCSKAIAKAEGK